MSDLVLRSLPGLVLLQLLLPLLELLLRVADVAAEAVGVEIVVAAGLGEGLPLLRSTQTYTEEEHEDLSTNSTKRRTLKS